MKTNPGGKNSPPGFSFCGLLSDDFTTYKNNNAIGSKTIRNISQKQYVKVSQNYIVTILVLGINSCLLRGRFSGSYIEPVQYNLDGSSFSYEITNLATGYQQYYFTIGVWNPGVVIYSSRAASCSVSTTIPVAD